MNTIKSSFDVVYERVLSLFFPSYVDKADICIVGYTGYVNDSDILEWKDFFSEPGCAISRCCQSKTRVGKIWLYGMILWLWWIPALVFWSIDVDVNKETYIGFLFHPNRLLFLMMQVYALIITLVPPCHGSTSPMPYPLKIAWALHSLQAPAHTVALGVYVIFGHDQLVLCSYVFNLIWFELTFISSRTMCIPGHFMWIVLFWVMWGFVFMLFIQQGMIEGYSKIDHPNMFITGVFIMLAGTLSFLLHVYYSYYRELIMEPKVIIRSRNTPIDPELKALNQT
jgi:hypothetical protein